MTANLLLLQAWAPPPLNTLNGVSWSLSVEAFFYAVAPVIIVASRRLPRARFLKGAAPSSAHRGDPTRVSSSRGPDINYYLYEQPALRLGEFVGVDDGILIRDGWRPRLPVSAAIGLAGLLVLAISVPTADLPGAFPEVFDAPTFALLIAAAASADLRGTPGCSSTGSSSTQASSHSRST